MMAILFFIFGAMVGSFLNVLILRLPKEQDVVFKSSHCPKCNNRLRWYMNIPILSFILLRGKCGYCGVKISYQYPLVEFFIGLSAIYFSPKYLTIDTLYLFAFYFTTFAVFFVHFIIDLRHKILPDSLNLYLLAIFSTYAFFHYSIGYSLFGFFIGLLFPLSVAYAFYKLKGVEGLGGGDIKLFAVLGVVLGPAGILQNLFLSCLVGSIIGVLLIALKKASKNTGIPFGPSIIFVASFQIFFPKMFEHFTRAINFSF